VLTHALDRRAFISRAFLLAGGAGLTGLLAACSSTSAPAAQPAPTAAAKPAGGATQPTSAAAAPATSASTSKVSFRLNFNPNAEHAPYYLGKKKGFYQAAGIDIDILPGTGSATTAKLVGTGDSMFGVAVADAVTVGKGQNIPLVSTAVLLQQSPTVLTSLQEKGIATPADLAGKKVGVNPQSTVYAFWIAFTKVNNIDRSKITEINTTGSALGPLIAGAFDATGLLLTNEVVTLEQQGKKLNILNYADYGVKSYGQVLFSSEKFLKDNPDLAKRFTAATLQSWQYTMDHVDEAIDALAEAVPETDKALEAAKWPPILKLIPNADQQVKFGQQTPEGWQQTYQTFKNGGLIDTDFDPTTLFRNDFLPA
jgi:NitT/TauT family transport system substrate-binding protein